MQQAPEALKKFANDVEFTLYYLSAALRGSAFASANLPQLREDQRKVVEARSEMALNDEFLLVETDRMTVSLNTLREQVIRYIS